MARITRTQLLTCLERAGAQCAELEMDEGGSAVLTTRGARLLGLFPGTEAEALNALWTNEELDRLLRGEVRDWEGDGAGSLGGERLWVGPERAFYYYRPETFSDWFCPAGMDPGRYRMLDNEDHEVAFENIFDLEDLRAWRIYRNVRMERRFAALADPFRRDRSIKAIAANLRYAGVRKTDTIELPDVPGDTTLNLWVLALVDPGSYGAPGTAVIPTRPDTRPVDYFGGLTEARLTVHPDHVAFRLDGEAIGKVGIRPEDLSLVHGAQIAAFLPTADRDSLRLLIHRSLDIPHSQGDCLDEAKADPAGPKGIIQAYNSGPGADPSLPCKRFGEIEIQMVAARETPDKRRLVATVSSDLLAFEGLREDVLALGRAALGVGEIELFA